MKYLHLLIITFLFTYFGVAQNINIPDLNFKNTLVNTNCVDTDLDGSFESNADTNNDGEISISEAEAVGSLDVSYKNISSLTGIEYFIHLEFLDCNFNALTNFDISNNTNLVELWCSNNQINTLDLSNNISLETLLCSNNQFSNLDVSNNTNLLSLSCGNNLINNLDVSNNINLVSLGCSNNQLTNLDVSNNLFLKNLGFEANQFTSLDISNNTLLSQLFCSDNLLTSIDVSNNTLLKTFFCSNNPFTTIDLSNNTQLYRLICTNSQLTTLDLNNTQVEYLDCSNNLDLTHLFMKNSIGYFNCEPNCNINFSSNPNLEYICANEEDIAYFQSKLNSYPNTDANINTYCTFSPSGLFYKVQGQSKINMDNLGCNTSLSHFKIRITDINNSELNGIYISDALGNYDIPLQAGNYTLTADLDLASYYSISPENFNVDFPSDGSPFLQDICLTPNSTFNDLQVLIIPIEDAIPGFNSSYKITYKNKGDSIISGNVTFTYQNEDVMNLVSANPSIDSQTSNTLVWNFTDLLPYETREILIDFNLNTPTDIPALNDGDYLNFNASIDPVIEDITPSDNVSLLRQIVVNSFDPNDMTCLEGDIIAPDKVGDYVHYLIRFENTGTANAVNVVLKDVINTSMFDVSSLIPIEASHNFYTRAQNDNEVEFIFENIDLPFDEANNDGYILFKIRTVNSLEEGDIFDNKAEIYFDFNFPIITNNAVTSIQAELSTINFTDYSFTIHPNPVNRELIINGENSIKTVKIYDIAGRLILLSHFSENKTDAILNVKTLKEGTYFIKVRTTLGEKTRKFIKIN